MKKIESKHARYLRYAFAASVAATSTVACATREPTGEEHPSQEPEGAASVAASPLTEETARLCPNDQIQAFGSWNDGVTGICSSQTKITLTNAHMLAAKKRAGEFFRYILGGPRPADWETPLPQDPYGKQRAFFQYNLCAMRAGLAAEKLKLVSPTLLTNNTCGLPTVSYRIEGYLTFLDQAVVAECGAAPAGTTELDKTRAASHLVKNVGNWSRILQGWCHKEERAQDYFRIGVDWSAAAADIDPEPAILNGSLGTASGAAAPSVWSATRVPVTSFRFPATFTSVGCTSTVTSGAPCSTFAAPAGTTIIGAVEKKYGLCRCIM